MKKVLIVLMLSISVPAFAAIVNIPYSISPAYANEVTPTTNPGDFESVKGTSGKRHKVTLEIWEHDKLHKNHWEVYKNKKNYDNGVRNRSVWDDGRPKQTF